MEQGRHLGLGEWDGAGMGQEEYLGSGRMMDPGHGRKNIWGQEGWDGAGLLKEEHVGPRRNGMRGDRAGGTFWDRRDMDRA